MTCTKTVVMPKVVIISVCTFLGMISHILGILN